jgi:hypothetical protein
MGSRTYVSYGSYIGVNKIKNTLNLQGSGPVPATAVAGNYAKGELKPLNF